MEAKDREEVKELIKGNLFQDSLEIGTPSKGGAIKLYANFANEKETNSRIDAAIKAKNYMNKKLEEDQ